MMKKIMHAFSGKKALYTVIVFAAIASAFEIATSIRNGSNTDWQGMAVCWVAICGWAACLKEKKNS